MNEVFSKDSHSASLTRLVNNGAVVVFVGSGLSTGVYPAWHELVQELCIECGVKHQATLKRETAVVVLTDLAGQAQKANEQCYLDILEDRFAKPIHEQKKVYQLLMGIPFRSYVTINLDPLLADEKNSRHEYRERQHFVYPYAPTKYLASQNLFYIHGYVQPGHRPDCNRIVLTSEAFHRAYNGEGSDLGTFWDVLLTEYPVLFVACGLREPEIQLALKRSHKRRERMVNQHNMNPPPLFVLRPAYFRRDDALDVSQRDNAREEQEQAEFRELDINIVRYDKKDKDHTGLLELLESWNPPPAINEYSPDRELWCQDE